MRTSIRASPTCTHISASQRCRCGTSRHAPSGPWLHRDLWPNAPSYKPAVSWPAYAYLKGAPEALLAYAQVRALAGGTTTIQGWPNANGAPANQLVRSVDDGVDPTPSARR